MDISEFIKKAEKTHILEYRSDYYQIRNIKDKENCILARLCRVRTTNKPKIGNIKNKIESDIKEDLIESTHFIYNKKDKKILMQANANVSNNSGLMLYRLLIDMNEKLKDKLSITLIIREDAIQEVLNNKGLIKSFSISIDKNKVLTMLGNDVDGDDCILNDTKYSEIDMKVKVNVGTIEKPRLKKILAMFTKKDVNKLKFNMDDGTLINLENFVLRSKINIKIDKNKNFITNDFYNKLQAEIKA